MDKTCSNCSMCKVDGWGDYVCANDDSEYVTDYVVSNHTCDEWVCDE